MLFSISLKFRLPTLKFSGLKPRLIALEHTLTPLLRIVSPMISTMLSAATAIFCTMISRLKILLITLDGFFNYSSFNRNHTLIALPELYWHSQT